MRAGPLSLPPCADCADSQAPKANVVRGPYVTRCTQRMYDESGTQYTVYMLWIKTEQAGRQFKQKSTEGVAMLLK